jgi:hypothetical protein
MPFIHAVWAQVDITNKTARSTSPILLHKPINLPRIIIILMRILVVAILTPRIWERPDRGMKLSIKAPRKLIGIDISRCDFCDGFPRFLIQKFIDSILSGEISFPIVFLLQQTQSSK